MSKFVTKLFKYRLLFKDILTFLGLNYIDPSYNNIVPCCNRNQYSKNLMNRITISHKKVKKNLNEHMDFLVMIIEFLRFPNRNHH